MKAKVSMIILSHLSNVQEMIYGNSTPDYENASINFVKYLILKYKDTDTEINPKLAFDEFMTLMR